MDEDSVAESESEWDPESSSGSDWSEDEGKNRQQGKKRKMKTQSCKVSKQKGTTSVKKRGATSKSFENDGQSLEEQMKNNPQVPVTCGNKEGSLDLEKFSNNEKCIYSKGRWFNPTEFEKFGGKEKNKKWKNSILCLGFPLQKLIEDELILSPNLKKRRIQDEQSNASPVTSRLQGMKRNSSKSSPAAPTTSRAAPITSPAVSRTSPAVSRTSPTLSRTSHSVSRTSPSAPTTSPAVSRTSPAVSRTSPAVSRTSPSVSRTSPSVSRTSPAALRTSPSVSRTSPAVSRTSPSVPRTSPSVSRTSPAALRTSPSVSRTSPAALRTSPSVSRTSPAALRTSPSVSRTSPAALRTSPSVSRSSPATTSHAAGNARETKSRKKRFPSSSDSEKRDNSHHEDNGNINDEEEIDKIVFQDPTLPVSCGSLSGILHKSRFATEFCGKCIRTEDFWLTPEEFIRLSKQDGTWKKDIVIHRRPLGKLIMEKVLEPHALNCECDLCLKLDQDTNDDVCNVCDSEEDLVCCDECPRAFHPHCHLPAVDKDSGSRWSCTFCTMKKVKGSNKKTRQDVLNSPLSQYRLHCQYLLLHLLHKVSVNKEMCETHDVKQNLQNDTYQTVGEFVTDIKHIFQHCTSKADGDLGRTQRLFKSEFETIFKLL